MRTNRRHKGFSLTEVLLAIGVLAVGVLFVAGVFPVGVHLTTVVTERTIAAIAADEAFAKVKLYAIGDPNETLPGNDDIDISKLEKEHLLNFNDQNIFPAVAEASQDEFTYPSTDVPVEQKHYYWTALCRRVGKNSQLVQVTVFVCRKANPNLRYYDPNDPGRSSFVDWPMPVKVEVSTGDRNDEIRIDKTGTAGDPDERPFINDGYTIVDDKTGRIYRVLERYASPRDNTILLDRKWGGDSEGNVWVVPPPVGGGRWPCVGVYQKVIRF
jgi:prepilin-type N-terminal cleavage/methylation domain-containing protein